MAVHNHPPYRPVCPERLLPDGTLRGACLDDHLRLRCPGCRAYHATDPYPSDQCPTPWLHPVDPMRAVTNPATDHGTKPYPIRYALARVAHLRG